MTFQPYSSLVSGRKAYFCLEIWGGKKDHGFRTLFIITHNFALFIEVEFSPLLSNVTLIFLHNSSLKSLAFRLQIETKADMEYYRLHISLLMWFSNSGQLLCLDSRSIGNSVISSQNSASLFSMALGPQFSIPCVHKAHKGFSKEEDMGSGPGSMQSIKKLAPTGPPAGSI